MSASAFRDLMEPGPAIRVLADVTFLSFRDGGEGVVIRAPYRPNHNFGDPDNREFYVGQVELPVGDLMEPGASREVVITFLNGPGLRDLLKSGRSWRIQEGTKLVASARVLSLLEE